MKNFIILSSIILFFSSCRVSLEKIQSQPQDWFISPVLDMNWDGTYPANRWADTLELNKPYVTYNKVPYIIREVTVQDGDSIKKIIVIESYMDETYKLDIQKNR